jgi:hypothetical protein
VKISSALRVNRQDSPQTALVALFLVASEPNVEAELGPQEFIGSVTTRDKEPSVSLFHRPQIAVQPAKGFFDQLVPGNVVAGPVYDPALVLFGSPEQAEHRFL